MRVVRIIARLNVGGPAKHVAWLEAGLRRRGVESLLVAGVVPPGEDDMGYFAESLGVRPTVIPEMSREVSPKDAAAVWKLYRLLRRERPDIVHTHTAKAGTVGRVAVLLYRWLTPSALWGRPRRCRLVHTYHGHIFHSYYGRWKTRFFLLVERVLARLATDRIVVISPQQLREIHEQFGVGRREQFAVVPLGLDTALFCDWAARREQLRREWRADERDTLVGIVGRLTEVKNHRLFLEAAALFKEKRGREGEARGASGAGRVRFVVVGDGHLRGALELQTAALGLSDDVEFVGLRDDPENFYPALDVVALTSLNEGTPLTLIEAMANSRAVVATAVGGVVDLLGGVEESELRRPHPWRVCERGVQVRPGDADAFADALAHLVSDGALRAALGERGREFVERFYTVERLITDVLHLYEELDGSADSRVSRTTSSAASREAETFSRAARQAGSDIPRAAARLKGD
ncbi:MAG TPA: glycosyltransferase [Pyrinomonadaceae bacterium]|jgi:glycosyltransferase involved in cell wall biosynthesis|nr:glycosyltransferase [Pyrinomonadaceae bacterium]